MRPTATIHGTIVHRGALTSVTLIGSGTDIDGRFLVYRTGDGEVIRFRRREDVTRRNARLRAQGTSVNFLSASRALAKRSPSQSSGTNPPAPDSTASSVAAAKAFTDASARSTSRNFISSPETRSKITSPRAEISTAPPRAKTSAPQKATSPSASAARIQNAATATAVMKIEAKIVLVIFSLVLLAILTVLASF